MIAMNALYRPGPMDYIPSFIARKHGKEEIRYDIPEMERYLKDTYGITVYQEQVMLLSRLLAGFTRGESDALRKAMGKKLIDKMQEMKEKSLLAAFPTMGTEVLGAVEVCVADGVQLMTPQGCSVIPSSLLLSPDDIRPAADVVALSISGYLSPISFIVPSAKT